MSRHVEITDELTNIIIDGKIDMAFSLSLCIFFVFISLMITEKRKTNYILKMLRYVFHSLWKSQKQSSKIIPLQRQYLYLLMFGSYIILNFRKLCNIYLGMKINFISKLKLINDLGTVKIFICYYFTFLLVTYWYCSYYYCHN